VCLNLGVYAAFAWFDGARAAQGGRPVTGSVTLFPGSSLVHAPQSEGFAMSFTLGWLPLAVGALAFVLASRPWRLLARRRQAAPQTST